MYGLCVSRVLTYFNLWELSNVSFFSDSTFRLTLRASLVNHVFLRNGNAGWRKGILSTISSVPLWYKLLSFDCEVKPTAGCLLCKGGTEYVFRLCWLVINIFQYVFVLDIFSAALPIQYIMRKYSSIYTRHSPYMIDTGLHSARTTRSRNYTKQRGMELGWSVSLTCFQYLDLRSRVNMLVYNFIS